MARKSSGRPQVVTANRLRDGVVVYRTAEGWTEHLADAAVAADAEALKPLEDAAGADLAANRVVAVYPFEVDADEAGPRPVTQREIIRAQHSPSTSTVIKTGEPPRSPLDESGPLDEQGL